MQFLNPFPVGAVFRVRGLGQSHALMSKGMRDVSDEHAKVLFP